MKRKYLRVMNGITSHAGGFEYKLDQVNVSDLWNPDAKEPKDIGGFNFSDDEHMLRWLLRGDVLYDVELPDDAEVLFYEGNNPKGVYRTNKIIVKNPKKVTEDIAIDLYLKSKLPEIVYFECLKFLSFKDYKELCLMIIRDKVNESNIDLVLQTFDGFLKVEDDEEHGCYKKIKEVLEEIKDKNLITICIDREPLIKDLTSEKIINITGQSGSGKSFFTKIYDDNYLIIDTDEIFSDNRFNKTSGINKELGNYFRNKYEKLPNLFEDFDLIYQEIIDYCKKYDKVIVIDCAQFHCIKDISLLRGKIIIMRTCIDTCYKRCIERFKNNNSNYTDEELKKYSEKKLKIYKWYKGSNEFLKKVINY